jgi:hypothetical protein
MCTTGRLGNRTDRAADREDSSAATNTCALRLRPAMCALRTGSVDQTDVISMSSRNDAALRGNSNKASMSWAGNLFYSPAAKFDFGGIGLR